MKSTNLFKRMTWNLLIAICFVIIFAMFAVGVVYAAATVVDTFDNGSQSIGTATAGTNEGFTDTNPQSPLVSADFGDLPDNSDGASFPISYDGLTLMPDGVIHVPVPNGLLLGSIVDNEENGFPTNDASGDDLNNLDDEEGITRVTADSWTNGSTVHLNVTVNGCADTCDLNGWIDWGMDGDFDGPFDQIFSDEQVTNGTHSLTIIVPPAGDYIEGGSVFARFRVCDFSEELPNSGCNALTGFTNNGEVEDYWWDFSPTAVELVSVEANTNYAVPFALLASALILLVSGGALLAYKRHRV